VIDAWAGRIVGWRVARRSETLAVRRRGPWRHREALAPLDRVDRFNHRRLLGPSGLVPPAEAAFHARLENLAEAA
jgi:putative transposase